MADERYITEDPELDDGQTMPPFIFYVFMQSKFKEGMTLSGIKG